MNPSYYLKKHLAKWILFFCLWTFIGIFFTSQVYLINVNLNKNQISWWNALTWTLPDWYIWALLTPVIYLLVKHLSLERDKLKRSLLLHLSASLVISFAQLFLGMLVLLLTELLAGRKFDFIKSLEFNFFIRYHWNVLTYFAIAAAGYAIEYYKNYKQREIQLTQAQLQALKAQLQPHFLFNTLNAISELMYESAETAERMVAALGNLLRITLDSSSEQEVTLKRELEFLNKYTAIEKIRFASLLIINFDIHPDTLTALVPNLLLQPLVENAIHHGISSNTNGGVIKISSVRENGKLLITIADNGSGIQSNQTDEIREGIGLSNTRSRLKQLYGDDHQFVLCKPDNGGLIVKIYIPFRTKNEDKLSIEPDDENKCTDSR